MLDIKWSEPYVVKSGNSSKWRREWNIPEQMVGGFFDFWKKNRFKLLTDGFSVSKSKVTNKWFLYETKDNVVLFKIFGNISATNAKNNYTPVVVEELPAYEIKDKSGLRTWQVDAAGKLVSAIKKWNCAIDGSDMGVGKTYTAVAVARELDYNILVICPKAVVSAWGNVLYKHFKMNDRVLGIVNYEKLKSGNKNSKIASYVLSRTSNKRVFTWKIPKKTLIVWDESQKLKNWKTQNTKMCLSALKEQFPMLFCSATNATNPLEMRVVGQALKIFKGGNKDYYRWARENGVYDGPFGLKFNNDAKILVQLHHVIFDGHGVRLRRDTIPNFPKSEIISTVYDMDEVEVKKINQIYVDMKAELRRLEKIKKGDGDSSLTIRLRARQAAELIKVPLFVDMAEDAMEQGFSVVIFVNFTDTISAIANRLNTKCIFDGQTPEKDRIEHVARFQSDDERVIIINIASGGAGLSLHDLNGKYPRLSLISPNDSAVLMRQCLGRIWRDNAKTKSIQKIIFVANTVEEEVCENVNSKLNNLDLLNDGDLI